MYTGKSTFLYIIHTSNSTLQLTELGVIPSVFNKIQSIMSQKYSGDITIIPEIGYSDFLRVLSNPTQGYVSDCIYRGQQATWSSKILAKKTTKPISNHFYRDVYYKKPFTS